ncbi:MAG TPA: hypothetical protein DCP92_23770 [Nitrospiraceae bacterium]|nr:hypothetical protein [Nitrospiraceae bacterium]
MNAMTLFFYPVYRNSHTRSMVSRRYTEGVADRQGKNHEMLRDRSLSSLISSGLEILSEVMRTGRK